jgi:hypothetical protein
MAPRRYEALVVMGVADTLPVSTTEMLANLSASGAVIGLITRRDVSSLLEQFSSFDLGTGAMLIAATHSRWCVVIDRSGAWVDEREDSVDNDTSTDRVASAAEQWAMDELWKRGIGSREVLLVVQRDRVDNDPVSSGADTVTIAAGGLEAVVSDQRARRQRAELPQVRPNCLWEMRAAGFDLDRLSQWLTVCLGGRPDWYQRRLHGFISRAESMGSCHGRIRWRWPRDPPANRTSQRAASLPAFG